MFSSSSILTGSAVWEWISFRSDNPSRLNSDNADTFYAGQGPSELSFRAPCTMLCYVGMYVRSCTR
jgi:hypothetical protein